jgi:hypothetical protein
MRHIDENALKLLLTAKQVEHFELREVDGGFAVFLAVQGHRGRAKTAMLITTRMKSQADKRPRRWASVDRFLSFLKARIDRPPPVWITLTKGDISERKIAAIQQ